MLEVSNLNGHNGMDATNNRQELLSLTTEIVGAFVGNNVVATADVPALISNVFAALRSAGVGQVEQAVEAPVPAVPIKRSVRPDFIICLEDGKKLKTLKRHLASRYNLTPEQYRQRWGLAKDYPMVAPDYAAQRSALAKKIGLGRKAVAAPPAKSAPAKPIPAARGRKKKAA
jgi:predicted transcriptional regulator